MPDDRDERFWYLQGWLKAQQLIADGFTDETAPSPLRTGASSITEHFGVWEADSESKRFAYEDGYWDGLVGHDNSEVDDEA